MGSTSTALEIARMVTEFLGPHFPRGGGSVGATLNALRTRLETDTATYDSNREKLAWDVREAIRTEFFKIIYPAPPAPMLLSLVTRTEVLLTNYPPKSRSLFFPNRPFFFPGARVAVPTEAGSRRAGTTLQLRFKEANNATVTEALLHLDGPNGGGFQWVQTPALTPLIPYHAPPPAARRPAIGRGQARPFGSAAAAGRGAAGRGRQRGGARAGVRGGRGRGSSRTTSRAQGGQGRRKPTAAQKAAAAATASGGASAAGAEGKKATKQVKLEPPPPPPPPAGPAALPPTFVPDALLSTSPPPRKRLRGDSELPISHVSGALRRALDVGEYGNAASDQAMAASVERLNRLAGVERLAARRKIASTGAVEYFVVWSGRSMRDGSWERRDALMIDVPGLVMDFDTRHPDEPKTACHSDRVRTEAEEARREEKGDGGQEDADVEADADEDRDHAMREEETEQGEAMEGRATPDDKSDALQSGRVEGEGSGDKARNAESSIKYIDDLTGIKIPPYLDTPILEVSFAGMVLQIRRANEYALHNDSSSAGRDYKKRQQRFKQEKPQVGHKLFPLSKAEAKSALEASLRSHKVHSRQPMPFPRGVGRVVASDTGIPFSGEMVKSAPPSWERYLHGLGLQPRHYDRNLPPHLPSLEARASHKLAVAARDMSLERAIEHRERARQVVRAAYRHVGGAPAPAGLFRDRVRRVGECVECFGERGRGKTRSPRVPVAVEGRRGIQDVGVAAALAAAQTQGEEGERWYDAHWSCWRAGAGPGGG